MDADDWRPGRFLDPNMKEGQVPIGLLSNLASFSGGQAGCIGWRFA
jgi:cytochrome P450